MNRLLSSRRTGWLLVAVSLGALIVSFLTLGLINNRSMMLSSVSDRPNLPAAAAKILVDAAGPVEITPSDLRSVGWSDQDLKQLRVSYEGQPWPVWATADRLVFYAVISPTRYMSQTVYWLERAGTPSPTMSTEVVAAPQSTALSDHYTATVRAEDNFVYTPQVETGDHWFWTQMTAPATRTFTLTLSALADGPAHLTIETWASTAGPANPDHRYRLTLNAQPLGSTDWDGSGWHTLEVDLPPGALRSGDNVLRVVAPGDTGVAADITFVNWLELRYPRHFVAERDRLEYDGDGGDVSLTGFSGPIDLFDITRPDRIARITGSAAARADMAGHTYLAVGPQGYESARLVPATWSPDLHVERAGADYIAIGPADLLAPLQPLLDWRASQGLKVQAIPVEAIYDQFGGGRVSPDAIQMFLQHAARTWPVKPRYVMLVGDASYDALDYTAPAEANQLPTFFVQTIYGGETASDLGFAQLDDDALPDLAVGRVPARTADQVRTFVEKTLAYEKAAPTAEWHRRVLAVADGQDDSFRAEAQAFLNRLSADYQPVLVNPLPGARDANRQIVDALNAGSLLVTYFGHGSVTQWGKDNLFSVKDVPTLQNGGRLPVIINMTCLTGLFTHPSVESLTENLLWQPDGGAVAVLAPTSLTLADDQSFLSNALVDAFLKDRQARLGDWVLRAWRSISPDDDGRRDVLRTFLLFGDPALKLKNEG